MKSIGLSQICGCVKIIFYYKIGKSSWCIDYSKIVQVIIFILKVEFEEEGCGDEAHWWSKSCE